MTRLLRVFPGLAPLGHRDFALYWIGQTVSQTGSWIEMTATTYLLYAITNSPVLLGLGGLARAIPIVGLAMFGGALADRMDRRRVLLITQCAQVVTSLVLGVLVVTGEIQFWHIYVIGAANSTLGAFDAPARNSFYPSLVPRREFQNAVTLSSIIFRLSTLVGPAIAGLLIALVGPASPFFVNAVSYFAIIGALLLIHVRPAVLAGARSSLRASVWGGIQYARRSPVLPLVLATEAALSIFGHNSALITIFARDVLYVGPEGLGLLLSAIGGGAIVGTIALVAIGDIRAKGAVLIGAGLIYAAALFAFAASTSFAASLLILFVLGLADAGWGAMRNTIAQLAAADAYRGRVMSLITVTSRGLTNASQIETGAIIAAAGPPLAAALNALILGAAVVTVAVRSPRLRRLRSTAHLDIAEIATR
ncbi:MAG TPA: MFS transporter [Candidatus Limnocylindria bacterium]|nr:MFS transporter [Candidatus Limnocylindria bacterium]